MTNIRNMLYGLAGARRITVTAILSLAVSFYVLGAVSSAAHEQPLASDLNLKFSPQRCGDKIYFFFNDRAGKNIDPSNFDSIMIVINKSDKRRPEFIEKKKSKGLWAPTLCPTSVNQMKVEVVHRNKTMELIIKRVPGDAGNIFLYSIPFSEGTYVFDFEYDLDKNCEDGVKGWHSECTISPKRLKKVTPDGSQ